MKQKTLIVMSGISVVYDGEDVNCGWRNTKYFVTDGAQNAVLPEFISPRLSVTGICAKSLALQGGEDVNG